MQTITTSAAAEAARRNAASHACARRAVDAALFEEMLFVAEEAIRARGVAHLDDLRVAGRSMNGVVPEPMVAGMTPAFTAGQISRIAPRVFAALRMRREAAAGRRETAATLLGGMALALAVAGFVLAMGIVA